MIKKPKIFVETTGRGKESWNYIKTMLKEGFACDVSMYDIIKGDFDIVELKKKSIESCTCHYLNDLKTFVKCYTHGYKEFKKRKKKNMFDITKALKELKKQGYSPNFLPYSGEDLEVIKKLRRKK